MIGIVNYGSGNIHAIANIYKNLNVDFRIIDKPNQIEEVDKLLLPGVGAFDYNMSKLNESGLKEALNEAVLNKKTPVLGICLGLQIMVEFSEEGSLQGLGWIKGQVKKFDKNVIQHKPKVPHMGWNSIEVKTAPYLFDGIDLEQGFYFIHSYYVEVESEDNILTSTHYGKEFTSGIYKENIYAVQFHPEKSHSNGIKLLKNFAELVC